MAAGKLAAQEIHWKGRELQAGIHKVIDGEISIRTADDTISANRAILINQPKRAVLQGNVMLKKDGSLVTGDSGVYYPITKQARVAGHAVIRTKEGDIFSESFLYNLQDRKLVSEAPVHGNAKGLRFQAREGLIFPNSGNIRLSGEASWENDSVKGMADTILLDKANQLVKMSRNARILYKKKTDEISGRYIELDLKENKISRIEGSEIRRQDIRIKASDIRRKGEDYDLRGNVKLTSIDSMIRSEGDQAQILKDNMNMQGRTKTTIRDKNGSSITIYAPSLYSRKKDGKEEYHFFTRTHIRGDFQGFSDSLKVEKEGSKRRIFLYRNCHLQNDSLYMEGDTLEILQDTTQEIIHAKRNAMMVMLPKTGRVNVISAANISLSKSDSLSEMKAENETESFLWNEEKGNVGINHTTAPFQKAKIRGRKVSKVTTKGASKSDFQPAKKANLNYIQTSRDRISLRYKKDSIAGQLEIPPLKNFLPGGSKPKP
jgi:lipopolysaccharide export system protein LptA